MNKNILMLKVQPRPSLNGSLQVWTGILSHFNLALKPAIENDRVWLVAENAISDSLLDFNVNLLRSSPISCSCCLIAISLSYFDHAASFILDARCISTSRLTFPSRQTWTQ